MNDFTTEFTIEEIENSFLETSNNGRSDDSFQEILEAFLGNDELPDPLPSELELYGGEAS